MKRFFKPAAQAAALIFFTLLFSSYAVTFKEQYYKLYHVHYQQYPDDVMENIYWLERAVAADFANPQFALTHIEDKKDWEKYRYLFMMHVNLKLIEQHMRLGRTWDKKVAYFYDAPWKEEYLRDLETAESCYRAGLYYWTEAKIWAEKANQSKFKFLYLTGIQNWEDESYRIDRGELNYEKILNRELARLQKVKESFVAMDENTY
ncbi:MAG: hypothetical protein ACTTKC_07310 [Treponema sp.]|uniref:hypothetical protein n=1 Tax=Treponema sp. TaxID=166 RepID=UPI003FA1CF0F